MNFVVVWWYVWNSDDVSPDILNNSVRIGKQDEMA